MYEKIYESTKLVQPIKSIDYWLNLFYVNTWDAFLAHSIFELSRVFRDGTKMWFGNLVNYTPIGRVNGFPAFIQNWTGNVVSAFEINGLPNPNEVLRSGFSTYSLVFIDDFKQVCLYQYSTNRLEIHNLENGQKIGEINHNAGCSFSSVSWVQTGQVVGMCKDSGKIRIMNYLGTPSVVEVGRIDPFQVAAYDCQNHNFVSIGADKRVRVYCREAWPAALSVPTFEPTTAYGLKANQVKTRLTGQDGEPCKGWWVHWELEGVDGPAVGTLDKAVSQTDADGYAKNLYYGPDDNVGGQSKLNARVVLY